MAGHRVDPESMQRIERAVHAFFPDQPTFELIEGRPWLVRLQHDGNPYVVRLFRPGTSSERVDFIHDWLNEPLESEFELRPRLALPASGGKAVARVLGQLADARAFVDGEPLGSAIVLDGSRLNTLHLPNRLGPDRIEMIASAIAELHCLPASRGLVARAPRLPIRLWFDSIAQSFRRTESDLVGLRATEPLIKRWIAAGRQLLPASATNLESVRFLNGETRVLCHLDLWPSHMLATQAGDTFRLTGLVDFAGMALASPVVDLAQAVNRGAVWSPDSAERSIAAYSANRQLSPAQRRSLPWLVALDALDNGGATLVALHRSHELLDEPAKRQVRLAVEQYAQTMEAILAQFTLPDRRQSALRRRTGTSGRRKLF